MRIRLAFVICILGLVQSGCAGVRPFRSYRFLSQNYDPVINNTSQTTRRLVPDSESYQVVDPANPSSTYVLTQDQDWSWVFVEVPNASDQREPPPSPKEERAK